MDAFLSFKTRFGGMPFDSPANVATGALFYSYEVGGVHIIALSAYEDLSATGPQTAFLLNDLAAVNRTRTPWLVCVWHPPIYNSNTQHYEQHERFRLAYEQLFINARVNVILNGHVHGYERTRMVNNNTLVDPATGRGIYYFTLGNGGKELYQEWYPFDQLTANYSATRSSAFWGFGVLSAPNATHMTVEAFCGAYDGYSTDMGANCTPGQLALAWVHSRGDDIFPIPGTKSVSRLHENLGAVAITITPEEAAEIEAAGASVQGDRYHAGGMSSTFNARVSAL